MNQKKIIKIFAVLISIALIVFLLSQITYDDVVATLTTINPIYLAAGFAVYLCSYLFRSLRYRVLLSGDMNLSSLFTVVCVHNLVNKILPARTGEVSYVYLLKRFHNRKTGEGIASLFAARVFDFILILVFLLTSLLLINDVAIFSEQIFWFIGAIFIGLILILVLILIAVIWFDKQFLRFVNRVLHKIGFDKYSCIQFIMRVTAETVESFQTMKTRRVLGRTFGLSIAIWLTMYLLYALLLYTFGIRLQLPEVILIVSFIAILPLLPIYSLGGFGTTEVTLTAILVALGVATEAAIVVSFGSHIVGFVYCIIAGLYGLWRLNGEAI